MIKLEMRNVVLNPSSAWDMLLTDPPCYDAWLTADFAFFENPERVFSMEHGFNVHSATALTVGDVARALMDTKQTITWRYNGTVVSMGRTTIKGVMQRIAWENRFRALEIKSLVLSFRPCGLFVPTEEQWSAMKRDGQWMEVTETFF